MAKPAKIIPGIDAVGEDASAQLSEPEFSAGHGVWVSTIHCPALFSIDKPVAGADAEQALELAEILVKELFDHHNIRRP